MSSRLPVLVVSLVALLLAELGFVHLDGPGARFAQLVCIVAMLVVVGLLARSIRD